MLLSCPAKKVTKECGQRGATKMRPLWYPPPLRRNCLKRTDTILDSSNEPGKPSGVTMTSGQPGSYWLSVLTDSKKRGPPGRAFCNKKRGEEKMKK